jgi:hypothetical protein
VNAPVENARPWRPERSLGWQDDELQQAKGRLYRPAPKLGRSSTQALASLARSGHVRTDGGSLAEFNGDEARRVAFPAPSPPNARCTVYSNEPVQTGRKDARPPLNRNRDDDRRQRQQGGSRKRRRICGRCGSQDGVEIEASCRRQIQECQRQCQDRVEAIQRHPSIWESNSLWSEFSMPSEKCACRGGMSCTTSYSALSTGWRTRNSGKERVCHRTCCGRGAGAHNGFHVERRQLPASEQRQSPLLDTGDESTLHRSKVNAGRLAAISRSTEVSHPMGACL